MVLTSVGYPAKEKSANTARRERKKESGGRQLQLSTLFLSRNFVTAETSDIYK